MSDALTPEAIAGVRDDADSDVAYSKNRYTKERAGTILALIADHARLERENAALREAMSRDRGCCLQGGSPVSDDGTCLTCGCTP